MRQLWRCVSLSRLTLVVAATSAVALAASGSISSAVSGSYVTGQSSASPVVHRAAASGRTRSYRLRWPSRPNQSATYHLGFKSAHLRAISLRVYRVMPPLGWQTVPRGLGVSYLVACEHRGPAALSWNWTRRGSAVRVTVKMTTGSCFPPGPKVAGTYAALMLRLVP